MKQYVRPFMFALVAMPLHATQPIKNTKEVPTWVLTVNKFLSFLEQQIKNGNLSLNLNEDQINRACETIENGNKQLRHYLITNVAKKAQQLLPHQLDAFSGNEEDLNKKLTTIDNRITQLRKQYMPLILGALRLLEHNIKAGRAHLSADEHTLRQCFALAAVAFRLTQPSAKNNAPATDTTIDASINQQLQKAMSNLLAQL